MDNIDRKFNTKAAASRYGEGLSLSAQLVETSFQLNKQMECMDQTLSSRLPIDLLSSIKFVFSLSLEASAKLDVHHSSYSVIKYTSLCYVIRPQCTHLWIVGASPHRYGKIGTDGEDFFLIFYFHHLLIISVLNFHWFGFESSLARPSGVNFSLLRIS